MVKQYNILKLITKKFMCSVGSAVESSILWQVKVMCHHMIIVILFLLFITCLVRKEKFRYLIISLQHHPPNVIDRVKLARELWLLCHTLNGSQFYMNTFLDLMLNSSKKISIVTLQTFSGWLCSKYFLD